MGSYYIGYGIKSRYGLYELHQITNFKSSNLVSAQLMKILQIKNVVKWNMQDPIFLFKALFYRNYYNFYRAPSSLWSRAMLSPIFLLAGHFLQHVPEEQNQIINV